MASITQQIPNYIGGISEQPDELKLPGQVRTLKNAFPDVTYGLMKRPGGVLLGSNMNSTTDGKWFHYYRDEGEQYIGQVNRADGVVKMWSCLDGSSVAVAYDSGKETALKTYLTHTVDDDIQTLTLNDFTYITNRLKEVKMDTTITAPAKPFEAYIELRKVAYASQYSVDLYDSTDTESVFTATRLTINRLIDSNNSCGTGSGGAASGAFPSSGTLPGSTNWNARCGNEAGIKGDSLCPNVKTSVLAVNHGDAGDTAQSNGVSQPISVDGTRGEWATVTAYALNDTVKSPANGKLYRATTAATSSGSTPPSHTSGTATTGGIAWLYQGDPTERKFLYFRLTTTGQSVSTSNEVPTYYCRYTTTHDLLYGGQGWRVGDRFTIWMEDAQYEVIVADHSEAKVQANLGLIRPLPTPFDNKQTITAESVLGDIQEAIIADTFGSTAGASITQIGNGLYITRTSANFNISTPVSDLLNVFTHSVKDVADLPAQCKHGYVVKVANSEADEDDYYVKFIGNNDRDGEGVWEECPQPGRMTSFDPATMPIQLVRQADGTFKISQVEWDPAQVGSETTANKPSFVSGYGVQGTTELDPTASDYKTLDTNRKKFINKMLFFRNRMVMLSDENVIMSRPGDFFNFWPKSAITFTASDHVDLSCSSEYPAIVYDGIQVNTGLLLFTKNQQFMLTTDSDVLSPNTAKINSLCTYNFNEQTNPVSLGTTTAFLDNAGKYTRFFEIASVLREGEPDVLEQSKPVARSFPKDITLIANSRENSIVFFGTKGKSEIFGFRYFASATERKQQAWFNWTLSGDVQHMAMLDDALYVVLRNGSKDVLQKFSIKIDNDGDFITDDQGTNDTSDDVVYRIHLDNAKIFHSNALTYNPENNSTTFTLGDGFNNVEGQLTAFIREFQSDKQGVTALASLFDDSGTKKVKLHGDWTKDTPAANDNYLTLGYTFEMEVEFPTIYVTQQSGDIVKADVHGSLIVHRTRFSLGPSGVYETTLERLGKPIYKELFEATRADQSFSSSIIFNKDQKTTLPVYEKNVNLTLKLKSKHPSPATLYSMTWEGDYTPKYYQRV